MKDSISVTKEAFEKSFSSIKFYNKQTQDKSHLASILAFLPIKPGMKILDLGTGSGYLAFSIAEKFPDTMITGLDIVEKALGMNRRKVEEENISNLSFISYEGLKFPFQANTFDLVISRYALHHFPDIQKSIYEVARVLNANGFFFICDPTPNVNDIHHFVDEYMQLKKDGHIKFYTKEEWELLCSKAGLHIVNSFDSSIRFPRKKHTTSDFEALLNRHEKSIVESYKFEMIEDEIYITEQVNNILFVKQ